MTKRTRRLFSAEFRLDAAYQNYPVTEAVQAMKVVKFTILNGFASSEKSAKGKALKASPMPPEQIEIRELKNKLARLK